MGEPKHILQSSWTSTKEIPDYIREPTTTSNQFHLIKRSVNLHFKLQPQKYGTVYLTTSKSLIISPHSGGN
jgi:hypothetical protein